MSSSKSLGIVKLTGILSLVAGIVLIIAGGVVWGMVSSQLAAEKITVTDNGDAPFAGGSQVKGPISAYAQAEVINLHAMNASGGLTYAELGGKVNETKAAAEEAAAEGDTAAEEAALAEADAFQAQRNTVMNGSFLRASLFTSVVAFGVSALVMGLGVMFILMGLSLSKVAKVEAAPALVEARKE